MTRRSSDHWFVDSMFAVLIAAVICAVCWGIGLTVYCADSRPAAKPVTAPRRLPLRLVSQRTAGDETMCVVRIGGRSYDLFLLPHSELPMKEK